MSDYSPSAQEVKVLREATSARKPFLADDPFRFLTGGGDLEHAWCFTGDLLGADPYYPITLALARRVMTDLGREQSFSRDRAQVQSR